jgi:hypothetical protein
MNDSPKPKKRSSLLKRIFRWILLPLFGLYVLFCLWSYLFQEPVLLEQNEDPTGYEAKPDLKPAEDDFLRCFSQFSEDARVGDTVTTVWPTSRGLWTSMSNRWTCR